MESAPSVHPTSSRRSQGMRILKEFIMLAAYGFVMQAGSSRVTEACFCMYKEFHYNRDHSLLLLLKTTLFCIIVLDSLGRMKFAFRFVLKKLQKPQDFARYQTFWTFLISSMCLALTGYNVYKWLEVKAPDSRDMDMESTVFSEAQYRYFPWDLVQKSWNSLAWMAGSLFTAMALKYRSDNSLTQVKVKEDEKV
ncbi:hypothetical protein EMPS_04375 [Entomortierella parvispora]|uniref:Uncharacterized protein n=1 Tax=Entomortierella parvispora TaxID=205924 RepID=A0A9P3H930_9FUNG|nr:hypothetical protein EMPS_04375 [Entomortierella parvispora]